MLWLTYKEDKGLEVPLEAITDAYNANDQLELYFDGNVAKLMIEPGHAASTVAETIRQSRTEPDR